MTNYELYEKPNGFKYPIVFPDWYAKTLKNIDDAIIDDIRLRNEAYEKLANKHRRENELKRRKHERKVKVVNK